MKAKITGLTWLCREDNERQRLLDMERRLRPVRALSMVILGTALTITGPSLGWWTLAPLAASAIGFALAGRGRAQSPRPQFRLAAAWLFSELAIAASIALTGGPRSPAVTWLAIPMVTVSARFSERAVIAALGYVVSLMLVVTVGIDPGYVAAHPAALAFPLASLGAISVLSVALMRSDRHYRGAAAIDSLTGMLNRNALGTRVNELSQQAAIAGQPIGLILGDIDCFKGVNDLHGHGTGDEVLRQVAARIRESLRAFDLAYRLGGEEFLVLLPGAGTDQAFMVAEQLRAAVAREPLAGLPVTMSFGVTASPSGEFDYETAFSAADDAMYQAKRDGRNAVSIRDLEGVARHPERFLLPSVGVVAGDEQVAPERVARSYSNR